MQMNMLAEDNRLTRLSELGDKLETVSAAPINWEKFRELLETAIPDNTKTIRGGRPPVDKIVLFKICLLQSWYGLSDEQAEYQVNDRLSFQRFLGMDLNFKVPDQNTIWTFKQNLLAADADFDIFDEFVRELEELGIITHKGTIIDATFVEAPRQRNTRDENKKIKNPYMQNGAKCVIM